MFNKIRDKVVEFFKSLSKTMKIVLIAGSIVLVILLALLIFALTRTKYVPIANGLSVEEASAVTSTLDSLGIPWKDEAGLSVILVPEKDVSRARMQLATTLTTGEITWDEVFKADNFTMTTGTREHMYVQAKATELQNAISTINSVQSAKVILYVPKESHYFVTTGSEARASIILNIKPGVSLDEQSINGIVNLTASAVKGLDPKDVTIVDQNGRQLNNPEGDSPEFNANNQYKLKAEVEKSIEQGVQKFLGNIYGDSNVAVMAYVDLDFDKESETRTVYSPPVDGETTGLIRSATRISENISHEAGIGVPGTDTNPGTAVTEGSDTGVYKKASETLNYELNESVKVLEKANGQIRKLSISVIVNTEVLPDEIMTNEHKTELISLIAAATGTPAEFVTVADKPFVDKAAEYDMFDGDYVALRTRNVIIMAVIIAVILIAIILTIILLLKKKKAKREEEEKQRLAELASLEETEEILDEIGEKEDKGSPKYQIERFIDKNPEAAVALLRTWMNE